MTLLRYAGALLRRKGQPLVAPALLCSAVLLLLLLLDHRADWRRQPAAVPPAPPPSAWRQLTLRRRAALTQNSPEAAAAAGARADRTTTEDRRSADAPTPAPPPAAPNATKRSYVSGRRFVDFDPANDGEASAPSAVAAAADGAARATLTAASSSVVALGGAGSAAAAADGAWAEYRLPGCGCSRRYRPAAVRAMNGSTSSCGGFADLRGPRQNVIAFSFYGNASSVFFGGIEANLRAVPQFYPGWVVRVYHDINTTVPKQRQLVCDLACRYDNLDFCDVHNLPGLGDLSNKFGMIWRFMPLADESVERFIVRDLDSLIGSRERAAVDEWIASNKTFHAMRDTPVHGTEILGGMWGGWNRHNDVYSRVRQRIIKSTQWKFKGLDQRVLTVVLWPVILRHRDLIAHDSFLCWYYPMSKPFPTQRKSPRDYVGSPVLIDKNTRLKKHCPYFCRPREHRDWLWC